MSMTTPLHDLIHSLQPETGWRCRTGIVLASPSALVDLPNIAARHGIDALDYAELILKELPPQTQFVALTADSEEARLRRIASADAGTSVVLLTQFDVALARLGTQERERLWQTILQYLTQTRRGLLIALPVAATRLLPDDTVLERLRTHGRLVLIED